MNTRTSSPRHILLLHGWHWATLPIVRVVILGQDRREFLVPRAEAPSALPHFDFEPDVRELVLEPLQYDRVAMWSDPLERLGLAASDRRVKGVA